MKPASLILGFLASVTLNFVSTAASAETLHVAASFSILADVVKQVGGDHVM